MPIFARNILNIEAAGGGALTAALGLGSLTGSFGLAAVRDLRNAGKWLILGVVAWHLSMIVFSTSTSFYLSIALLLVTGVARGASMVLVLSILLRNALSEYRGRIMGLRVLAIYAHPLGSLVWGGVAGGFGAPLTVSMAALVGIALTGILTLFSPKLRKA